MAEPVCLVSPEPVVGSRVGSVAVGSWVVVVVVGSSVVVVVVVAVVVVMLNLQRQQDKCLNLQNKVIMDKN